MEIIKGELNQVLTFISLQIGCDPQELISYAAEDVLGGYHFDPAQATFPIGSLWGVEGQILYALVRHLKPDLVVEIGGWAGASASHLALAVMNNSKGRVVSVDSYIGDSAGTVGAAHGTLIPNFLKPFVELVNADGRVYLNTQPPNSIGMIFEDADHSASLVAELSRLALAKLEAGGYLVNHDAGHDQAYYPNGQRTASPVAAAVHEGLVNARADFKAYLAAPSDCGVAITVARGEVITQPAYQNAPNAPAPAGFNFPTKDVYEQQFESLVPKSPEDFLKRRDFVTGAPIGNANIESQSAPPPIETPTDPTTTKKPTTKKKPATKKAAPKAK